MLDLEKYINISLQAKLSIVLFCSLALMSFLPQLRSLSFFNYLWPLNMAGWLFFAFLTAPNFFIRPSFHRLVTYIFFAYVTFIAIASGNGFLASRYLEYMQLVVFLWGFEFYLSNFDSRRINEKIIIFLSPFVLLTSVNTVYMYIFSPNISRTAKKDTVEGLEQMSQGVGGYDFVYFIVFIFAGLMYLSFVFDRKLLLKTVLLSSAALFLANIVLSNFMIALILGLLAVFFRFIVYKTSKSWMFVYTAIIILMIPTLSMLFDIIFDLLISLSEGTLNQKRLMEIKFVLESGIVQQSLGARLHAFDVSWRAFLDFPYTGIIINNIKNSSGIVVGFGQHSFLLDAFALFGGVVGFVNLYVFLAPVFKMYYTRSSVNYSSLPLLMIFMVLILYFVNNVTPSVGLAVYFFVPVVLSYMRRKAHYENS